MTTSRARQKIRHFIQAEEKARSIELGKRLFEKEARRFELTAKMLNEEAVLKAAAETACTRWTICTPRSATGSSRRGRSS